MRTGRAILLSGLVTAALSCSAFGQQDDKLADWADLVSISPPARKRWPPRTGAAPSPRSGSPPFWTRAMRTFKTTSVTPIGGYDNLVRRWGTISGR